MSGLTICEFCRKSRWAIDPELGGTTDCDCSGYKERYLCRKSDCSERKESENYCREHKDCCRYDNYCKKKVHSD